ncbi:hypothetical protein HID58_078948, partial [Brassica napus]
DSSASSVHGTYPLYLYCLGCLCLGSGKCGSGGFLYKVSGKWKMWLWRLSLQTIRNRRERQSWTENVWFKGAIPSQAF